MWCRGVTGHKRRGCDRPTGMSHTDHLGPSAPSYSSVVSFPDTFIVWMQHVVILVDDYFMFFNSTFVSPLSIQA